MYEYVCIVVCVLYGKGLLFLFLLMFKIMILKNVIELFFMVFMG